MRDLRGFAKSELSFRVFDDNYFKSETENLIFLKALIDEEFLYTQEQLEYLYNKINVEKTFLYTLYLKNKRTIKSQIESDFKNVTLDVLNKHKIKPDTIYTITITPKQSINN